MDVQTRECKPTGDLTIFEVASFKDSLVELLSCGGAGTLDLSLVGQVDSSALQLILAALRTERLCVSGASDEVKRKLERIGGSLTSARV